MKNSVTTRNRVHSKQLDERALQSFITGLGKQELMMLRSMLSKRIMLESMSDPNDVTDADGINFQRLTARENQVLTLIASGYTRPEVAEVLSITRNTAATHIASIYRKLDVGSIAEATLHAYRWGLVA